MSPDSKIMKKTKNKWTEGCSPEEFWRPVVKGDIASEKKQKNIMSKYICIVYII